MIRRAVAEAKRHQHLVELGISRVQYLTKFVKHLI